VAQDLRQSKRRSDDTYVAALYGLKEWAHQWKIGFVSFDKVDQWRCIEADQLALQPLN
jgi:hypothetical protein